MRACAAPARRCTRRGLDALVVSTPHNIAYLTNFDGSTALAVVTAARLYLLSDFRYSAAVTRLFDSAGAPPETEFVLVDGSYDAALARVISEGRGGGDRDRGRAGLGGPGRASGLTNSRRHSTPRPGVGWWA